MPEFNYEIKAYSPSPAKLLNYIRITAPDGYEITNEAASAMLLRCRPELHQKRAMHWPVKIQVREIEPEENPVQYHGYVQHSRDVILHVPADAWRAIAVYEKTRILTVLVSPGVERDDLHEYLDETLKAYAAQYNIQTTSKIDILVRLSQTARAAYGIEIPAPAAELY